MATSGIQFDLSTVQDGLRAKLRVTKKTEAEILNQAGGSVVANAIRLTKKASAADIRSVLQSNGTVFRLLQSPQMQRRLSKKLVGYTRGTHTRAQINAAAAQLIRLRVSSRGYIAAGWFPALATFRPGSRRRVSARGLAGQGRATRATPSRLVATIENFSRGAGAVGAAALQQALNEEGASMQDYAKKKLAAAWR